MGSRKKPAPAELRTIDLFTKLTPLEAAKQLTDDERAVISRPVDRSFSADQDARVQTAIRWLGLEHFGSDGDDLFLAIGPKGHGVLSVVSGRGSTPRRTQEIRLSATHIAKLRELLG